MTTIIIPNYNGLDFLKNCLKALDKQTYKDFSVLVVDNGSNDGSVQFVRVNYANIQIMELDKNYGFTGAVNQGIRAVHTEFVVLLNNDTVPDENWLKSLVLCMELHPDAFSCCSKMVQVQDENIIDDAGDGYTIFGWAYKGYDGESIEKANRTREITSCCAGAAIYRRSIFEEIGYFNDAFFAYLEDVDLSLRALRVGYRHFFCHNAIVTHVGSATSGGKYNDFKVRISARNSVWTYRLNMACWLKVVNFIPYLFGTGLKYIAFSKKGFGKVYRQGILEGYQKKPYSVYKDQIRSEISLRKDFLLYIRMCKDTLYYLKIKLNEYLY